MKINDEGTSNAAYWYERAMKAEARLAEAEHLILRMAGEDYQRARFYVEKYDLTGERAAVSATACLHQIHNGGTCEICGAKVTP
jgi:hypothetical protein